MNEENKLLFNPKSKLFPKVLLTKMKFLAIFKVLYITKYFESQGVMR